MKKILIIFTLIGMLTSCVAPKEEKKEEAPKKGDRVEILYFHGKKRCPTCVAIEGNTAAVVDSLFADKVKDGSLVFRIIDLSTREGEAIGDEYEVSWSSLILSEWRGGNEEKRTDWTEYSFANARNNPEEFRNELAGTIRDLLKSME